LKSKPFKKTEKKQAAISFSLGLLFDPEDGSGMFVRKVGGLFTGQCEILKFSQRWDITSRSPLKVN
jgi:hypothetical protein